MQVWARAELLRGAIVAERMYDVHHAMQETLNECKNSTSKAEPPLLNHGQPNGRVAYRPYQIALEGHSKFDNHRFNVLFTISCVGHARGGNSVHRCSPVRHALLGDRRVQLVSAAHGPHRCNKRHRWIDLLLPKPRHMHP